jgi:hypothetical protein
VSKYIGRVVERVFRTLDAALFSGFLIFAAQHLEKKEYGWAWAWISLFVAMLIDRIREAPHEE